MGGQVVARIETQLRLRDSWMSEVEALRADPKALDDVTIVNSFIKAHAMRQAMEKLGMLYDA
jgi:hypothetical protein